MKESVLVAAAVVFMTLGGSACTQKPASRPANSPVAETGNMASATDLKGKTLVVGTTGEKIGEIKEVPALGGCRLGEQWIFGMARKEVEVPRNRLNVIGTARALVERSGRSFISSLVMLVRTFMCSPGLIANSIIVQRTRLNLRR